MRLFLVPSVFFLLACSGLFQKKEDTNNGKPAHDTTSSTSDNNGSTDVLDPFGPCSEYGGALSKGATWTYDYADEQGNTGTYTITITSRNSGDATYETETVADYDYPSMDNYHSETTTSYHCSNKGLFIDASTSVLRYSVSGKKYNTTTDVVYDDPYLVLPADLAKGDSWTSSGSGTSTTDGTDTPFDFSTDCEIKKVEDVSVEAGDYSALKEVCDYSGTTGTSWLASGVGLVQSTNTELVKFSP